MDLIITILPGVTKDLSISPRFTPYNFLSRDEKIVGRGPGRDGKILSDPRQDGNAEAHRL